MIALWAACGLTLAALIVLLVKHVRLKRDVRQLGGRLIEIMKSDTNAKLTTITFDVDMSVLVEGANILLAKSRKDFYAARRTEADLKRAITNISHDLRTPLTSAKGYLQMLESGSHEDPARYYKIIRGRLETLAMLMDSLFAFSRAMEGNVTIRKANIGNIVRDVLSDSYVELENKGFTVESRIPDAPVYAHCDEDALKRVLQNLIKNAYVHGKEYLRVELKDTVIEITNKADGLNDLDVSSIFDRFYTADAARTHKQTGLGLAIAKELTRKMHGNITALQMEDMLTISISLPQ